MILSTVARVAADIFKRSKTFWSRSNSFIAYQRLNSESVFSKICSERSLKAFSTLPSKPCCAFGLLPEIAILTTLLAASSTPIPFNADISTTGQPI